MKTSFTVFIATFFISLSIFSQAEDQKELYIIGAMHGVPKIVKNSYKPMLKKALKYDPQAIYVEAPMPNDTISWEYLKKGWSKGYQRFYALSDSLRSSFDFNKNTFNTLLKNDFASMSAADLDYLISSFGYLRDNANHEFYTYIKKYGVGGSKVPTRYEDGDLTAKLALAQGIKRLQGVDDQRTNKEFHDAWNACLKVAQPTGDNAINQKMNKNQYNKAILPGILGNLGRYVNTKKSLERLHISASFRFTQNDLPECLEGTRYFDERNERIANNTAQKIMSSDAQKSVLIIGAAHVIGLVEEFRKNYPNIRIKLMDDSI